MNTSVEKSDHEMLTVPQRIGELWGSAAILGLFGFLLYHQQTQSGFFTEKFGVLEMFCLFVPLLLGLAAPIVRAWTGQRNPARPYEIATSLLLALGSLWLLIVFPFSFAHLADTLSAGLHFALAWVTDDIGKILLILQIIISPASAFVTAWRYVSHRPRAYTNRY